MFTLLLLTTIANRHITQASSTATVYIDPPEITGLTPGENFTISASVANVSNLAGWEFRLYFLSRVIYVTDAQEGPFLKNIRNTIFLKANVTNNYNTTHGLVYLACALLGTGHGADGSGTLATINFTIVGGGETPLHLPQNETKLLDSTPMPPGPQRIPHTTTDGYVYVKPIGVHDIAIRLTTTSKTIVGQGYPLSINVTTHNKGNFTETFNLTVYCNTTTIETQTITLPNGTSTITTFTWNTTGLAKGNYTISAYASPVPDEVYTPDNTFKVNGAVCMTKPGDVDGDRDVDLYDVVKMCSVYGVKKGDQKYEANSDVNNDEKIDLYDVVIACSHYGETV